MINILKEIKKKDIVFSNVEKNAMKIREWDLSESKNFVSKVCKSTARL